MRSELVQIDDRGLALRHNGIERSRGSLLFLHGLGDSGRAFDEAFSDRRLDACNLIVPDMPGHGEGGPTIPTSSTFDAYVALLWSAMDILEVGRLVVIGHSMGGAIGTLFCAADAQRRVRGFVNVEGNLLVGDQFISRAAVSAADADNFDGWFHDDFMEQLVHRKWAPGNPACQRYYAALRICRPEAFLENCRELVARSSPVAGNPIGEIAAEYLALTIPKRYCWGEISLPPETLAFLEKHGEARQMFPGASHTVMVDAATAFYADLMEFAGRLF